MPVCLEMPSSLEWEILPIGPLRALAGEATQIDALPDRPSWMVAEDDDEKKEEEKEESSDDDDDDDDELDDGSDPVTVETLPPLEDFDEEDFDDDFDDDFEEDFEEEIEKELDGEIGEGGNSPGDDDDE